MADGWIINGIPGSGKSTPAHRLAAQLDRGAHIEGDRLQEWIVAGGVPPGRQPPEEERRQIELCVRNQCLLAASFAAVWITPVIDYMGVSRARLEAYRRQLPGLTLRVITLTPSAAVALERDRLRPEKTVSALWVHLEDQIRSELTGHGLWLDNTRLTVEESVERVLSRAGEAEV
jgi:hypothetical protein